MRFPELPDLPRLPALPSLPRVAPDTRRRIAMAAVGLSAVAVIVVAIVGASPGAGRPDPRDLVPASALTYTEVHIGGDRDQPAAAGALSARLPLLSQQVVGRLTAALPFRGAGLLPEEPWLGDDVAFAGLRHEDELELLASDDAAAALRYAKRFVGNPATTDFRGIRILSGKRASAAMVGDFLAIGTGGAVRAAIDTSLGAPSLAAYRPARSVLSALPAPSFARTYVAPLAGQPLGPALGTLRGPAAAAVRFTDGSLEVAAHVRLDRGKRPAVANLHEFKPALPRALTAGTLGYLGSGPPSAALRALFVDLGSALSSLPSGAVARLGVKDLKKLARRISPVLGNETALAILPGGASAGGFGSTPSIGLISKGVAATGALHALRALGNDVSGVVRGNRLLLAGDASALRGLSGTGKGLTASGAFRSATAGLSRQPAIEAYLDIAGLVPLFEAAGLAENPAYASFAPEIHRLGAVAATVRPSKHALDAALRLTVIGK